MVPNKSSALNARPPAHGAQPRCVLAVAGLNEPPAKRWRAVIEKSSELYLYQALHQWCFMA